MTCKNCGSDNIEADTKGYMVCTECGLVVSIANQHNWDTYFHSICIAVASKSPCLSRKIGAILVKDKSIVATGYNGPSRGIPHCGHERNLNDNYLHQIVAYETLGLKVTPLRWKNECPRRCLGYESGTHMELCPAQHAEVNAISNAARLGVSVLNSTLYMNCLIPCKNCFGTLINAGIVEIVVDKTDVYDKHTQYLIDNSLIKIRRFEP